MKAITTSHVLFHIELGDRKLLWLIADRNRVLKGRPQESRRKLRERWDLTHPDNPIESITRFEGIHRLAEMAMTLASLEWQHEI